MRILLLSVLISLTGISACRHSNPEVASESKGIQAENSNEWAPNSIKYLEILPYQATGSSEASFCVYAKEGPSWFKGKGKNYAERLNKLRGKTLSLERELADPNRKFYGRERNRKAVMEHLHATRRENFNEMRTLLGQKMAYLGSMKDIKEFQHPVRQKDLIEFFEVDAVPSERNYTRKDDVHAHFDTKVKSWKKGVWYLGSGTAAATMAVTILNVSVPYTFTGGGVATGVYIAGAGALGGSVATGLVTAVSAGVLAVGLAYNGNNRTAENEQELAATYDPASSDKTSEKRFDMILGYVDSLYSRNNGYIEGASCPSLAELSRSLLAKPIQGKILEAK